MGTRLGEEASTLVTLTDIRLSIWSWRAASVRSPGQVHRCGGVIAAEAFGFNWPECHMTTYYEILVNKCQCVCLFMCVCVQSIWQSSTIVMITP